MADFIAGGGRVGQRLNPLQTLGEISQVQGNLLQQKALNQQINANVAASEAFKNSVDPSTGRVDLNKAASILAQDPRGAYNVPELMGKISQQQSQQLDIDSKGFNLQRDKIKWMRQNLSTARSPQDVVRMASDGIKSGMFTAQELIPELQQVSAIGNDPAAFNAWKRDSLLSVMDAEKQFEAVAPRYEAQNLGDRVELIQMNPNAGPVGMTGVGGELGLSPESATQMVDAVDPMTGAPIKITRSQAIQQAQGVGAPQEGRITSTGLQSGLQPGQQKIIEGAAERYDSAVAGVQEIQNAQQGLMNALDVVDKTSTGVGSSTLFNASGLLNTLGLPVAKDATENSQVLKKYLSNQLQSAMKANGNVKSDVGLDAFMSSQPNMDLQNPKALKKVIKFVAAQNNGALARTQAMQEFVAQNGPSQLPKFEAEWGKAYNPYIMYMRTLETPQEKQEFWDSVSERQKSAMKKSAPLMSELGAFR